MLLCTKSQYKVEIMYKRRRRNLTILIVIKCDVSHWVRSIRIEHAQRILHSPLKKKKVNCYLLTLNPFASPYFAKNHMTLFRVTLN